MNTESATILRLKNNNQEQETVEGANKLTKLTNLKTIIIITSLTNYFCWLFLLLPAQFTCYQCSKKRPKALGGWSPLGQVKLGFVRRLAAWAGWGSCLGT